MLQLTDGAYNPCDVAESLKTRLMCFLTLKFGLGGGVAEGQFGRPVASKKRSEARDLFSVGPILVSFTLITCPTSLDSEMRYLDNGMLLAIMREYHMRPTRVMIASPVRYEIPYAFSFIKSLR